MVVKWNRRAHEFTASLECRLRISDKQLKCFNDLVAQFLTAWYLFSVKHNRLPTATGLAQLTLVEHSLCPLDSNVSLQPERTHCTKFSYSKNGKRLVGQASLHLPLGLSSSDEFYLWGLLALTLRQPDAEPHFAATPHYCLRKLGVIDTKSRRGGRNYEQFRQALKRIAAASYSCDSFYDPVRQEHANVAFGFLSYRLPQDAQSNRLWNFYWDPVFYELCGQHGGRLSFDLNLYRQLDPASRRLFLLLHKVFYRRELSPVFSVRRLCEDVLGFSGTLTNGELNRKLLAIIEKLQKHMIVTLDSNESVIRRTREKTYVVQFRKGTYFRKRRRAPQTLGAESSSLTDALASLGFENHDAAKLQRRYKPALLKEWIDITLAAKTLKKIRRTPQAFLVDHLKHAADGSRTAPDWWLTIRKQEDREQDQQQWQQLKQKLSGPNNQPSKTEGDENRPKRIGELLNL